MLTFALIYSFAIIVYKYISFNISLRYVLEIKINILYFLNFIILKIIKILPFNSFNK